MERRERVVLCGLIGSLRSVVTIAVATIFLSLFIRSAPTDVLNTYIICQLHPLKPVIANMQQTICITQKAKPNSNLWQALVSGTTGQFMLL